MSKNTATITFDAGDLNASFILKVRDVFELLTEKLTSLESLIVAHRSENNEGFKSLRSEIVEIRSALSTQCVQPLDTSIFNQPIHNEFKETVSASHVIQDQPIRNELKETVFVSQIQPTNATDLTPSKTERLSDADIDSLLKLPICSPLTKEEQDEEPELPFSGISIRRQNAPPKPAKPAKRQVVYAYDINTDAEQSVVATDQSDNDTETEAELDENESELATEAEQCASNASFKSCEDNIFNADELEEAVEKILNENDSLEKSTNCEQSDECNSLADEYDTDDDLVAVFTKDSSKSRNSSKDNSALENNNEEQPKPSVFAQPIESIKIEEQPKSSVFAQLIEIPVILKQSPLKATGNVVDLDSTKQQSKTYSPETIKFSGNSTFGKPAFGTALKTFADLKSDAPAFLKKTTPGENPFAVDPKQNKIFSNQSPCTSKSDTVSAATFSLPKASGTSNQLTGLKPGVTGEEGESIWFESRCKLFQFFSKLDVRERGVGNLKLLESPQTGALRCVMRRDQIHKVCANFNIIPNFTVGTSQIGPHILTWSCKDFSDPEKPEGEAMTLICQFKDEDTANLFKKLVNNQSRD